MATNGVPIINLNNIDWLCVSTANNVPNFICVYNSLCYVAFLYDKPKPTLFKTDKTDGLNWLYATE